MKKYIKFAVAVIASVVFLVGVYFLYDKLSEEYKPEQNLVVEGTNTQEESEDAQNREGIEGKGPSISYKDDDNQETSEAMDMEIGISAESETMESTITNSSSDTTNSDVKQSNFAIDFVMEDVSGNEVNLFDFVGKPIVLNFWASWCGPCKAEIPDFQEAYEKYEGDVEFLMVNMTDGLQETKESAISFIEEQGYILPFYFDTQMQGAYTYGVYSLPMTFFISAEGEIIAYAQGMIDGQTLTQGISMIYEK